VLLGNNRFKRLCSDEHIFGTQYCTSRTGLCEAIKSSLPPKADIQRMGLYVRLVPVGDIRLVPVGDIAPVAQNK